MNAVQMCMYIFAWTLYMLYLLTKMTFVFGLICWKCSLFSEFSLHMSHLSSLTLQWVDDLTFLCHQYIEAKYMRIYRQYVLILVYITDMPYEFVCVPHSTHICINEPIYLCFWLHIYVYHEVQKLCLFCNDFPLTTHYL